jgi:hypothetical protein
VAIMTFKWTGIPPKEFHCLSTFAVPPKTEVALNRTQLSARIEHKQQIKQRIIINTQKFTKILQQRL